jgi:hypothetical protein
MATLYNSAVGIHVLEQHQDACIQGLTHVRQLPYANVVTMLLLAMHIDHLLSPAATPPMIAPVALIVSDAA